jgi:hypothetical protein
VLANEAMSSRDSEILTVPEKAALGKYMKCCEPETLMMFATRGERVAVSNEVTRFVIVPKLLPVPPVPPEELGTAGVEGETGVDGARNTSKPPLPSHRATVLQPAVGLKAGEFSTSCQKVFRLNQWNTGTAW